MNTRSSKRTRRRRRPRNSERLPSGRQQTRRSRNERGTSRNKRAAGAMNAAPAATNAPQPQTQNPMKTPFDQKELDRMRLDPDNYKWGFIYYNPKDLRIILPKRNQNMGWTLNFAQPESFAIMAILIGLAIGLGSWLK